MLDRLATLALADGDASRAAELRRRKAQIDRALNLYRTSALTDHPDDPRAPARLAAALGRQFEAHAFWTMAVHRAPSDREARLALDATPDDPSVAPGALPLAIATLALNNLTAPGARPAEPDPAGVPLFIDDAKSSGLAFVFQSGETSLHQLPEIMAGGVGLDRRRRRRPPRHLRRPGRAVPPRRSARVPRRPPLPQPWRRDVRGRHGAVGRRPRRAGYGHGVAVGDVDNDGHPDLFLTRWRVVRALRNRGDGTFDDITAAAGLAGDRGWPTSAAFADLDGDGDLDLYVCHYVAWDAGTPAALPEPGAARQHVVRPQSPGARAGPRLPQRRRTVHRRHRRFGPGRDDGRGLGVVAADLDDDGRVDLFVANDGSANFFWRNRGGFRFEEAGLVSGLSANAAGGYQAGMGVACGDLDGDGRVDLAVTNFFGESTSFYKNLGRGDFSERSSAVGLVATTRPLLGFGIAMVDADNDGRLDLFTANGHVNDFRPAAPYAMPAQLLVGRPDGTLADVSARAGEPFRAPHLGRGLAAGDLDNDGRVDALVVALDEPMIVLRNRSEAPGHWLTLSLVGTASNRDAVGAVVTVRHGGARQVATRFGGGSYCSAGDPRLHFGLGASRSADAVEVRWPSGRVDTFAGLEADCGYALREGEPAARPLAAFRARAPR